MNLVLWKKAVQETRWVFLGCAAALISLGWLFVWATAQLDTSRFRQLLDLLPGNLKKFTSVDFEWMITYPGRIAMMFDEPMVILVLAVFCITRASDCVSGELGRGTLEMVLSQPVSRLQVLFANWVVMWIGIALLVSASWLGVYLGVATNSVTEQSLPSLQVPFLDWKFPIPFVEPKEEVVPMSERVDVMAFTPAVLNFFCLGIFLAGITSLLSACDRYRWRTIGIISAFYVVSGLLKIAGMASDDFSWLLYLSFFTLYEPEAYVALVSQFPEQAWHLWVSTANDPPTHRLGPAAGDAILLMIGIVTHVVAAVIFCRRDLPAPL